MTEVPEHLLRRSRERREALGLASPSSGEAPAAPAAPATAAPAAVESADADGGEIEVAAAQVPAEAAYTGPPQLPPRKPRVPVWAMPVVAALPFWAILYAGAFGERAVSEEGPLARGKVVYASAGCSGCHGPTGGGGVGPALGDVEATFPNFADHSAWIVSGSAGVKGQPYGATGRIANGGMPAFGDSLSEADIVAVTCYERVEFGGVEEPPECATEGGAEPAEESAES